MTDTSNKVHKFQESLKVGEAGEKLLDAAFSSKFDITVLDDLKEQKKGIDRVFKQKSTGTVCTVEYKTDARAADTGNIFIEIWSNKQKEKKGWAYTSQAQWLYFYLPGTDIVTSSVKVDTICVIPMTRMKRQLKDWYKTCRKAGAVNRSGNSFYTSEGLLVPIADFMEVCHEVLLMSELNVSEEEIIKDVD